MLGYNSNAQQKDSIQNIKKMELDEVQVVGIRPTLEEPVTMTTIEIDSVQSGLNATDPFFLIQKESPSIFSQSDNGTPYSYSYIKMRGLDQTRINFTLNGIPLNEMEDQGIYFSNMPGFINNVRKMQVQRGIGTSKYGTTSIAGSVNMETPSLLNEGGYAEASYGSYNTFINSLGYTSGVINETLSFSSRFTHFRSDGFKDNSESDGFNFFGQIGLFDDNDIVKIYGFTGKSRNQMAWFAPTKTQIDENYRVNGNTREEFDDFGQNFIAINWVNFKEERVKINASGYYNNINGYYLAWLDSALMGNFALKSHQAGAMMNIVYDGRTGKNGLLLNSGLNYNYYRREHTLADNDSVDDLWYKNFGYKQDAIGYVKANYTVDKYVNIFADVQYRYVNFSYDKKKTYQWHFVNPKLGIKYLRRNWNVYASGAMTQREVTRTDLLNGYDDVTHLGGNSFEAFGDTFQSNSLPERVYDLEVGGGWKNKHWNLNLNYYMMYFNNERVAYGEINYIGLSLKKPVDRSIRTGVEFDGSYNISGFTIGSSLTYSYNRIFKYIDNDGVIYRNVEPYASPMILMNNYIQYDHKFFYIGFNGNYVYRSYLDNTQNEDLITPANYIVNGYLGFNIEQAFTIRLNVNNIMGTEYYTPAGVSENPSGMKEPTYYVGALRNFLVTIKANF